MQTVTLAAVATVALTGFLPWIRTGNRERSSFELINAARSLDVLDSGVQRTLAVAWFFVPLLAALCWLAVLLHRPRVAAPLAIAAGAIGIALTVSLERVAIPTLPAVRVTLLAAVATTLAGLLGLAGGRAPHE